VCGLLSCDLACSSSNGTFVNGKLVGKNAQIDLAPGDALTFSKAQLFPLAKLVSLRAPTGASHKGAKPDAACRRVYRSIDRPIDDKVDVHPRLRNSASAPPPCTVSCTNQRTRTLSFCVGMGTRQSYLTYLLHAVPCPQPHLACRSRQQTCPRWRGATLGAGGWSAAEADQEPASRAHGAGAPRSLLCGSLSLYIYILYTQKFKYLDLDLSLYIYILNMYISCVYI